MNITNNKITIMIDTEAKDISREVTYTLPENVYDFAIESVKNDWPRERVIRLATKFHISQVEAQDIIHEIERGRAAAGW